VHSRDLLLYAYEQVQEHLRPAVEGLSPEQLAYRPSPDANSIAWLAWHLARIQDSHIAEVAGTEQVWTAEGWADRFDLPFAPSATGYGFTSEQVAQVRVESAGLLLAYAAAVHARTAGFLRGLTDNDLDRVVDENWDPPVTLGVRLVSVLDDDLQHVGQAAYVRGFLLHA
jgi:uncharacterized damage-inducible protein DinB